MTIQPMSGEKGFLSSIEKEINRYVLRVDLRRNVIKADLGVAKKGQFPMALVENAHRYMILILIFFFY